MRTWGHLTYTDMATALIESTGCTIHNVTEQDDQQARQGYLILADISGYTAFLTGTELEHSHVIIREPTKLIRERLSPPMRFVKLEGDAVFCYAEAGTFADGERFVELIEVCYFDFSNRLLDMTHATTCRCDTCKAIPTLGLKFVTHFGTFISSGTMTGKTSLDRTSSSSIAC